MEKSYLYLSTVFVFCKRNLNFVIFAVFSRTFVIVLKVEMIPGSRNTSYITRGLNNVREDSTTIDYCLYKVATIMEEPNSKRMRSSNGSSSGSNGNTTKCVNYINGKFVEPESCKYLDVINPATDDVIGTVGLSDDVDVDNAVRAAHSSFLSWSSLTVKARVAIMLKFHSLIVNKYTQELAELIVQENGKNITEALGDVAKGAETVEYSCSLPQVTQGRTLRVSTGVTCEDQYRPQGVVCSIVPFNFPFMVPMWTVPIALVMGNCVILKPSEKVPLTMFRVIRIMEEAGFPPGVFNVIQGTKACVEALIAHPIVKAVTFVGSSPVAKAVSDACHKVNKRCIALGGAKNHLVALPDCQLDSAASDITVSFAGCAGQRCMAASVLLLVGNEEKQQQLIEKIVHNSMKIQPGQGPGQLGPVIDSNSFDKILSYISKSETEYKSKILLDGRTWDKSWNGTGGHWIGPTVILHSTTDDVAMKEEIFGPVLSIYQCSSWEEAIAIENLNPFGNAASVYTCNGGNADWFLSRFNAAMLGCNIGIPVPREPFSFGGLYGTKSKYGDMDITGDGAVEFFTNRIKISSKWHVVRDCETTTTIPQSTSASISSNNDNATTKPAKDAANFAGSM